MPRRFFRKRKFYPRKYKTGGSKKMAAIATKVYKRMEKKVTEEKYWDVLFNSVGIDYGGSSFSLCDVPQGDGDSTRDGDKLCPVGLKIKLLLTLADTTNTIRLILVRWIPSTSSLSYGGVIQNGTGTSYSVAGQYQHDTRKQFKVLWSRSYALSSNRPQVIVNKYVRLQKRQISYVSASTTGTNKLFLLAISDSAAAAHPTIGGYTRLDYTDK